MKNLLLTFICFLALSSGLNAQSKKSNLTSLQWANVYSGSFSGCKMSGLVRKFSPKDIAIGSISNAAATEANAVILSNAGKETIYVFPNGFPAQGVTNQAIASIDFQNTGRQMIRPADELMSKSRGSEYYFRPAGAFNISEGELASKPVYSFDVSPVIETLGGGYMYETIIGLFSENTKQTPAKFNTSLVNATNWRVERSTLKPFMDTKGTLTLSKAAATPTGTIDNVYYNIGNQVYRIRVIIIHEPTQKTSKGLPEGYFKSKINTYLRECDLPACVNCSLPLGPSSQSVKTNNVTLDGDDGKGPPVMLVVGNG